MERRSESPFQDEAGAWVVTRYGDALAVLEDPGLVVPSPGAEGPPGTLAWLRRTVCRFTEGEDHRRRRAIAASALAGMEPATLRQAARTLASQVLAASGVTTGGVTTDGVTTDGVATGGVATGGVATGGVTTDGVATDGVTTDGVATGAVAAGGVATDDVAAGGVAGERVALVARRVPVAVLGRALGVDDPDDLARLTEAVPVVAAVYLTGTDDPETREAADAAVGILVELLGPRPVAMLGNGDERLAGGEQADPRQLARGQVGRERVAREPMARVPMARERVGCERMGCERVARGQVAGGEVAAGAVGEWVANRIAVLVQACEATAGLVERAVRAVGTSPPVALRESGHSGATANTTGGDVPLGTAAEPGRWPAAAILAETSRFDPPIPALRRVAAADTVLGGRTVTAGSPVVVDVRAANRDPQAFAVPDRFAPSRVGRAITFGGGRRECPGREQAMALAAGVLEALCANVEGAALCVN